jgi:hypothetical protein
MTVEALLKDISKSAGLLRGSDDEQIVHNAVTDVMGNKYKPVTIGLIMKYANKIESNIYRKNGQLGRRVAPHIRSVLKK